MLKRRRSSAISCASFSSPRLHQGALLKIYRHTGSDTKHTSWFESEGTFIEKKSKRNVIGRLDSSRFSPRFVRHSNLYMVYVKLFWVLLYIPRLNWFKILESQIVDTTRRLAHRNEVKFCSGSSFNECLFYSQNKWIRFTDLVSVSRFLESKLSADEK